MSHKDDIQPKRWEESTSIPSESAYKEFEDKPVIIIHDVTSVKGGILHSNKEPVSAPSESQEEMWNEVLNYCELHAINDIRLLEYMVKKYKITRNP